MNSQYEVLNPWAEVDPMNLRGISPRLTDMANKKIGMYYNSKRAALPMLNLVEAKLKEKFPTLTFSYFLRASNESVIETDKAKYEEWLKGVDAVILTVGD